MSNTLLTDSTIFARRNLEHIRQVPEKLTNVTIQPLMFVVLFAYVFGGAIDVEGAGYKEYLIGGILIQTLAFAMMGPAMSIATDLQEGVIDRFRSLPSRRSAYLLGHYFAEMLGSILTIVILLGTGLIIGWRTHAPFLHVIEALALLLVFASAIIWIGLWLGILVRSPDAVMGIGFVIIFPLTFISNAFVPIESMPNVSAVGGLGQPGQRADRRGANAVRQPGLAGHQTHLADRQPGRRRVDLQHRPRRCSAGSSPSAATRPAPPTDPPRPPLQVWSGAKPEPPLLGHRARPAPSGATRERRSSGIAARSSSSG